MDSPTVDLDTQQTIEQAAQTYKEFADQQREETPSYEPGDCVWLSIWDLHVN